MKILVLLFIILCSQTCIGQKNDTTTSEVEINRIPYTPTQDSLKIWSKTNGDFLTKLNRTDSIPFDRYYLDKILFNGWAYEIFPDNRHKYRYSNYVEGERVWQITYYDSGTLSSDFRTKFGVNGSSRMWHFDGSLYIDTYYNYNGVPNGLQMGWYKNGEVSRKALFENGNLIYEFLYEPNGLLKSAKGEIPQEK